VADPVPGGGMVVRPKNGSCVGALLWQPASHNINNIGAE